MGRTKKKGLDYFPFDVDFFQDIRIRKLIRRQGGKAVVVYVLLLCSIYKNGYYMVQDEDLAFIVSEQTGFEELYIQEVLRCCLALGLFNKELFEKNGIYTSKSIQERFQKICRDCKRICTIDEFSLISSEEKDISSEEINISSEEKPINSEESTQSKVKKRKEIYLKVDKENPIPSEYSESNLEDCYAELSSNASWAEVVTMNTRSSGFRKFTLESFQDYLKRFFMKLQNEGETRKSPKDAQQHFARWLKIELKNDENRRNHIETKQEVNDYAMQQYLDDLKKLEEGVHGEISNPF